MKTQIKTAALFFGLIASSAGASTLVHDELQLSSKGDLKQFKRTENSPYDPAGTFVMSNAHGDFIKIRFEKTQNDEAAMKRAFQKKVFQFSLLFETRTSPYKGAITSNTECFDKTAPEKKIVSDKDSMQIAFETRATKNFAYGKCDGEEARFFSKYLIIVCKKAQKIFDVRLYSDNKKRGYDLDVKCAN